VSTDTDTPTPDPLVHCRRCGTCCLKGGPVLHREDLELVRQGHIPLRDLVTICPGEPVHDNVKGRIRQTENDRIKIQPHPGSAACRYYDTAERACTIYARRPLQCRVLKCWDTADLEAVYDRHHLSRKDLLGDIPGLWELVDAHGRRCDHRESTRLAARIRAGAEGWEQAEAALLERLRYDQGLRDLIQAQGRPDPDLLPFLLGSPLQQRLRALKLRLIHAAGRYRLDAL
jgi:Fe-S-cluster containining protein